MATTELTRSAAARLEAAIHAETVGSLKRAAIARAGLAVAVAALLGAMWQEWFAVSWWAALIFLFAAFGAAQWALAASRHHRGWHAYLFTTLDAALIAFGLLWPNPLGPPMAFDIQMLTRSYTFVFFTLLVAMSALSFSWRVVLYAGAACSLSWAIGVPAIAARPESVTAALISAETLDAAGLPDSLCQRLARVAPATLRGRDQPVELWSAA